MLLRTTKSTIGVSVAVVLMLDTNKSFSCACMMFSVSSSNVPCIMGYLLRESMCYIFVAGQFIISKSKSYRNKTQCVVFGVRSFLSTFFEGLTVCNDMESSAMQLGVEFFEC